MIAHQMQDTTQIFESTLSNLRLSQQQQWFYHLYQQHCSKNHRDHRKIELHQHQSRPAAGIIESEIQNKWISQTNTIQWLFVKIIPHYKHLLRISDEKMKDVGEPSMEIWPHHVLLLNLRRILCLYLTWSSPRSCSSYNKSNTDPIHDQSKR